MVSDLPCGERPREKLARAGPECLSDAELLALVLRTGYAGQSVLALAAHVIKECPQGLRKAGFAELRRVKGVGKSRAAAIAAAFELAARESGRHDARPVLDSPSRVHAQVPPAVRSAHKEHFVAFYVNARSQLLHYEVVSIGTLSASLVHPREVFAPGIAHAAAACIVVHNHPSGDCAPSGEDKEATRRLSRCGQLLGIPVLDHVIVAGEAFFSFKDQGLLS